jgi:hypothetical protein
MSQDGQLYHHDNHSKRHEKEKEDEKKKRTGQGRRVEEEESRGGGGGGIRHKKQQQWGCTSDNSDKSGTSTAYRDIANPGAGTSFSHTRRGPTILGFILCNTTTTPQ